MSSAIAGLVVFLARRLVICFVLELLKSASASLDRLHGLFLVASIRNGLLARLSCTLLFIFVLFLIFVLCFIFAYLFGRACTILRTRD